MNAKRMGGLGKLSDFGKTAQPQSKPLVELEQSQDVIAEPQSASSASTIQVPPPQPSDSVSSSSPSLNFRLESPDIPVSSFLASSPSPLAPSPSISSAPIPLSSASSSSQDREKLATVNIKITQGQQEWLSDTAKTVRSNNSVPVPPGERVFPQHLIGVAIDLLQSHKVDWSKIKNEQDLRKALKL